MKHSTYRSVTTLLLIYSLLSGLYPSNIYAEETGEQLIINEVCIGSEVNPEKDVWIELYNPGESTIALDGWQIKGVTKGGRWINLYNDSNLSVEPNGYFLLSYYSNSSYSALNIKPDLKKSSLTFPNNPIEISIKNDSDITVDSVHIDIADSGEYRSYERIDSESDGMDSSNWAQSDIQMNLKDGLENTYGTPKYKNGNSNNPDNPDMPNNPEGDNNSTNNSDDKEEEEEIIEDVPIWYPDYELISEIMVNPEGKDTEGEWVELFNESPLAIDIGGWYLDDSDGNSRPYRIRDNTWIGGGSYRIFSEPDLKLSFKNSEDTARLLDPNKIEKESIAYTDAKEGWSYALNEDKEFAWTPLITPKSKNSFPEPPKAYLPDSIIIYSVLPNPKGKDSGSEIIVLKSNSGEDVDLTNWKLSNLKGKEYELSELSLKTLEKKEINPFDYGISLVNKEDKLSIIDPVGNIINQINWSNIPSDQIVYKVDFFTDGISANVTEIIDGDTIKIILKEEEFTVRFIGIDTPETVHPTKKVEAFGIEAKEFIKNRLLNKNITLKFDKNKFDKYNRLLAYIYVNNKMVNSELIKVGLAKAYLNFPFIYSSEFEQIESNAKDDRIGMWTNLKEDIILNEKEELTDDEISYEEDNEIEEDELEEEVPKAQKDINQEENLSKPEQCGIKGLMIDSIMPNAKKGETQEYIMIKNISNKRVCLLGWQLDDVINDGSKLFNIRGGAIMPGGVRRFRKSETKISLNNSNDCANLINPIGNIADRICYLKTHKNEVFNHDGSDWKPKIKKKITRRKKRKSKKNKSTKSIKSQELVAFQWDLVNKSIDGKIVFIYEDGEIFYIKNKDKIIPVSYANSKVNISKTKELLDLNNNVKLDIRSNGKTNELVAISQTNKTEQNVTPKKDANKHIKILPWTIGILVFLVGGLFFIKKD